MPTTPILASSIYETAKKIEYTYKGKDYLKGIAFNYLELRTILSKPKRVHTDSTYLTDLIKKKNPCNL